MSNKINESLYYSESDEWLEIDQNTGTIGISDYAQDQLGDIVYVEELQMGKQVKKGDVITTIESVKAVSDIYTPVSGVIEEVNQKIVDDPAIINQDPYGDGWIVKIKMNNPQEKDNLMTAKDYAEYHKD